MIHIPTEFGALKSVLASHRLSNGVAYRVAGVGLPMILLHGSGGSWNHWTRNVSALARGWRVYLFDLPGFGDSGDVDRDISVHSYVDRVHDAVLAVCQPPICIVGFSFGGLIASGIAARLGSAINRLSLIAPSGFGPAVGRILGRKSLPNAVGAEVDSAAIRDIHRHNLLAMMLHDPNSIEDDTIDIQIDNKAHSRFNSRHLSQSSKLEEFLASSRCPVQLIYGESDKTSFPSVGVRIDRCRRVLPILRADIVARAGHWVQYERAAEVNRLLAKFAGS